MAESVDARILGSLRRRHQRRLQLLRSDDNLIEVGRLAPQVGRPRELRLMDKREMAARSMSRSSGTCKICGTSKDHRSARTCPIVKNRDPPAVWLNSEHDRLQFIRNVGSKSFSRIYTPSDREVEAAWPTDLETLPVPEGTLIVVVTRLWLGVAGTTGKGTSTAAALVLRQPRIDRGFGTRSFSVGS